MKQAAVSLSGFVFWFWGKVGAIALMRSNYINVAFITQAY
jgi:hypothetical protein